MAVRRLRRQTTTALPSSDGYFGKPPFSPSLFDAASIRGKQLQAKEAEQGLGGRDPQPLLPSATAEASTLP